MAYSINSSAGPPMLSKQLISLSPLEITLAKFHSYENYSHIQIHHIQKQVIK